MIEVELNPAAKCKEVTWVENSVRRRREGMNSHLFCCVRAFLILAGVRED